MFKSDRSRAGLLVGKGLTMFAMLIAGSVLAPPGNAAPRQLDESRPSFRCDAILKPVERMICADAELRAYDRAMAIAYSVRRRGDQIGWLERRDACRRRGCILDAYREWFERFEGWDRLGRALERRGPPPADGSELLLAGLQSPSRRVDSLGHSGSLIIRYAGGGWYLFRADAEFYYDPHDGRGANASTSEADGLVRIAGGKGTYELHPGEQETCRVEFTRLPRGAWKLVEDGRCSGLGSNLTGIYRR